MQLHANELILRHLIDEATRWTHNEAICMFRPNWFSSANCEHSSPDLLLCKFDAIPSKLPELLRTISDFSTDQQYLYEIYQGIISGSCTVTVLRNLLDVIQGRWLIHVGTQQQTAFYALYVSSTNPSPTLKIR